jgi:DNA-directed RNA polymerase specialized sigma24 family protein
MRYFFDLPEANVADELRISVGTVKSTSSRALAKLRISADPPGGAPADLPASPMGSDQR